MILHLCRVEYGNAGAPPGLREYRVREFAEQFGRSPVGSIREIADFVQERLNVRDFILEIYDPISSPDANERFGYGRFAGGSYER